MTESYGIPHKIIRMIEILYADNACAVLNGGEESELFKFKQGDGVSVFLFLMVFGWIKRTSTNMYSLRTN